MNADPPQSGDQTGARLGPALEDRYPLAPERREVAEGSFRHKNPPEIVGTGYVVKSLEAALWAFHRTDDFRAGALAAVNLGRCRYHRGDFWADRGGSLRTGWVAG